MATVVVAAVVAPALVSAPAAPGAPRCKSTVNVKMGDSNGGDRLFFSERKVTIHAGSCVRWTWTGKLEHQVTGPGFESKTHSAPFRYRRRFASARGAPAQIVCSVHPSMRMKVAVKPR